MNMWPVPEPPEAAPEAPMAPIGPIVGPSPPSPPALLPSEIVPAAKKKSKRKKQESAGFMNWMSGRAPEKRTYRRSDSGSRASFSDTAHVKRPSPPPSLPPSSYTRPPRLSLPIAEKLHNTSGSLTSILDEIGEALPNEVIDSKANITPAASESEVIKAFRAQGVLLNANTAEVRSAGHSINRLSGNPLDYRLVISYDDVDYVPNDHDEPLRLLQKWVDEGRDPVLVYDRLEVEDTTAGSTPSHTVIQEPTSPAYSPVPESFYSARYSASPKKSKKDKKKTKSKAIEDEEFQCQEPLLGRSNEQIKDNTPWPEPFTKNPDDTIMSSPALLLRPPVPGTRSKSGSRAPRLGLSIPPPPHAKKVGQAAARPNPPQLRLATPMGTASTSHESKPRLPPLMIPGQPGDNYRSSQVKTDLATSSTAMGEEDSRDSRSAPFSEEEGKTSKPSIETPTQSDTGKSDAAAAFRKAAIAAGAFKPRAGGAAAKLFAEDTNMSEEPSDLSDAYVPSRGAESLPLSELKDDSDETIAEGKKKHEQWSELVSYNKQVTDVGWGFGDVPEATIAEEGRSGTLFENLELGFDDESALENFDFDSFLHVGDDTTGFGSLSADFGFRSANIDEERNRTPTHTDGKTATPESSAETKDDSSQKKMDTEERAAKHQLERRLQARDGAAHSRIPTFLLDDHDVDNALVGLLPRRRRIEIDSDDSSRVPVSTRGELDDDHSNYSEHAAAKMSSSAPRAQSLPDIHRTNTQDFERLVSGKQKTTSPMPSSPLPADYGIMPKVQTLPGTKPVVLDEKPKRTGNWPKVQDRVAEQKAKESRRDADADREVDELLREWTTVLG